jgi:predicted Na+-dependent transporter
VKLNKTEPPVTGTHAEPPRRSAPVAQRVAHWLERRLVPLVVGAAALGVAFPTGGRYLTGVHGIPVTLAVLATTTGIALTIGQLRASRTATARLLGVLVITSVALPALAWGTSQLTDPGPMRQGVLAGVAPAEVASVALVGLGGGEAALTAALLIGSTLVTVLAAGPILSILGSAATVSSATLLIQLLLVVALPLTAGIATRHALRPNATVLSASTALGTLALLDLLWQVASQITLKPSYVSLTLAVLVFLVASTGLGWLLTIRLTPPRRLALTLPVAMRDFAVATGIATAAFSPANAAPLGACDGWCRR